MHLSHCLNISQGEHEIEIDHSILGKTCGLLPVGIESTVLSTSGLKWNLSKQVCFSMYFLSGG